MEIMRGFIKPYAKNLDILFDSDLRFDKQILLVNCLFTISRKVKHVFF